MKSVNKVSLEGLVDRLMNSFLKWYSFRQEMVQGLPAKIRQTYANTTDGIARRIFIHLKNRFNDIGPIGGSIYAILLSDSDSDRRVLGYNYEDELTKELNHN